MAGRCAGHALSARAIEAKSSVEGGTALGAFGIVDVTQSTGRDGFIDGAPQGMMAAIFTMAKGELRVFEGPDFVGLVQLDSIQSAPVTGDDADKTRAGLSTQIEQQLAQDAFQLFSSALTAEAGIRMDDAAINAVNAQIQ